MSNLRIWQDYACPISLIDFDLHGPQILSAGEQHPCAGCGLNHTAGGDIQLQTYVVQPDGSLDIRGIPSTEEEKVAWIAEAGEQ